MKMRKKNLQTLSEALKTNLKRRKAERKNGDKKQEQTQANAITTNKIL